MDDLAVIILNYNTNKLTQDCIRSVLKNTKDIKYEIWVVDNASTDKSVEEIKKNFPEINLIENKENGGFSKGNNLALKKAKVKYYLLLNSDTIVLDNALKNLVDFAKENNFDIVSCKLLNNDKSFQPNVGNLPKGLSLISWITGLDDIFNKFNFNIGTYHLQDEKFYKNGMEVGWVGGTAMLIGSEVIEKIGYLDENIFMYAEDVDYCWRAQKAGFKVGWTNKAEIIHLGGGSSHSPKFNQWKGEFKGLLYIYQKYYGRIFAAFLKLLFYIFIAARALGFLLLGKLNHTKTYVQVFTQI
ncbi:MAG: glycosyltransferase [Candidatus Daviesbacteria bacterium GW2011_GWA2_38_24]|uniref:Glycosyltransferase n=1 Tax=Candidatus Daviesbacteria bacterium GW2011_GWA2_38_24 TaxID=1618422 RepID=A0A0G0JHN1_9BACT|nr:MAG: glycosyltransferase [Candidatus Daviesbacteria bacterium GW2011_GWA2_38_24]KKQ80517.1 MAG: glycosyltransferase [Candidatus Daviesbacteria bacterium GW2011_GWA1_38_7]OGE23307.1 MAG: hypothetical protein A2688_04350 [Candidatus Daviesbacteria bacterium RIFCSPHIGHO2_01_FULL_38_8]